MTKYKNFFLERNPDTGEWYKTEPVIKDTEDIVDAGIDVPEIPEFLPDVTPKITAFIKSGGMSSECILPPELLRPPVDPIILTIESKLRAFIEGGGKPSELLIPPELLRDGECEYLSVGVIDKG